MGRTRVDVFSCQGFMIIGKAVDGGVNWFPFDVTDTLMRAATTFSGVIPR